MFEPQTVNLTIYQGSSFKKSWQITDKDSANPIDLTGYTARMQIRGKLKDIDPIVDLTTENGGITIEVAAETTTLSIYISATDTAAIEVAKGVYDLELIDTSADVYRLMEGIVTVSKEVTR